MHLLKIMYSEMLQKYIKDRVCARYSAVNFKQHLLNDFPRSDEINSSKIVLNGTVYAVICADAKVMHAQEKQY